VYKRQGANELLQSPSEAWYSFPFHSRKATDIGCFSRALSVVGRLKSNNRPHALCSFC
jgi:hypothetical protein